MKNFERTGGQTAHVWFCVHQKRRRTNLRGRGSRYCLLRLRQLIRCRDLSSIMKTFMKQWLTRNSRYDHFFLHTRQSMRLRWWTLIHTVWSSCVV